MHTMGRGIRTSVATAFAALLLAAPAFAGYMPVDTPGPKLKVSSKKARAALDCGGTLKNAAKAPVLLLHGTSVNSRINWSWNYVRAFGDLGIPWCALDSPHHAEEDIQISSEYIVRAIRMMQHRSGRRVSMVGHSQGGMVGRWPLRWWPDVRRMVDDYIGFAATNHGSSAFNCEPGACTAAGYQQQNQARFIQALNSGQETFKGVSYTNVYSHTDETVQPAMDDTGSSSLHTGDGQISNVAIQDICPLAVSEHLMLGTIDPVAYALTIDALTHKGPADPERISGTVCGMPLMPYATVDGLAINGLEGLLLVSGGSEPPVPGEPKLACYTKSDCRRRR